MITEEEFTAKKSELLERL
ncbi:MAG: hypothetical protein IJR65_06800 [Oscillospiraceae bacterium]|nr:hypothetical protein [Oscillospiraceae bacterium]